MQSTQRSTETIKIKFKTQGKQINKLTTYKGLTYQKFIENLGKIFEIKHQKYYRLFYIDSDKQEILINVKEDFDSLMNMQGHIVLYLQETEDGDLDFRQYLEKTTYQTQYIFRLKKAVSEREQVIRLLQIKYNQAIQRQNSKIQPLSNIQCQIESQQSQNRQSAIENSINRSELAKKVRQDKAQILHQLEKFKSQLTQKSTSIIQDNIKMLHQDLSSYYQKRGGTFKHPFGCQSGQNCKFNKRIIGHRFKCVVCSINLCEHCADEEFSQRDFKHVITHPMMRYRVSQYDSKIAEKKQLI